MQPELYFEYGTEGGGEELYKQEINDVVNFYTEGSNWYIDENDEEQVKKWKRTYNTFEEYWAHFAKAERWYMYHVLFIHPEIKEFIRENLKKVKKVESYKYVKSNWESALSDDATNFGRKR